MQVKGDPVTCAQAGDIILFTSSKLEEFWSCVGKDSSTPDEFEFHMIYNHRFPSSQMWGWCDWDGSIHANSYDLNESWPSTENLLEEWEEVAHKFPFLNLTFQIFNHSYVDYINGEPLSPALELQIQNGKVSPKRPIGPIFKTLEPLSLLNRYDIYGDSIEIPWDLWAPAISALSRHGLFTEKKLGLLIDTIEKKNYPLYRFFRNLKEEEIAILEDYAMSKGWLGKPPKLLNCWPIRKAAKYLGK